MNYFIYTVIFNIEIIAAFISLFFILLKYRYYVIDSFKLSNEFNIFKLLIVIQNNDSFMLCMEKIISYANLKYCYRN